MSRMFDYAFSQYTMHSIYKPGEVLGIVKVQKGDVPEISIQAEKDYSVLVKKGVKNPDIRHEIQLDPNVKAPVAAGQVIGKLSVYQGNRS